MSCAHANMAIRCTVQQCKNHSTSADYCSLDCITVGTHENNPTVDQPGCGISSGTPLP